MSDEKLKNQIFNLKKEMKALTKGNKRLKADLAVMTECAEEFERITEIYEEALKKITTTSPLAMDIAIAMEALNKVDKMMEEQDGSV